MRVITDSDLIAMWEAGHGQHPVDRALIALRMLYPDRDWRSLTGLPVGARDMALLSMRAQLFGQVMQMQVSCPKCSEALQFDSRVDELQLNAPDMPAEFSMQHGGQSYVLSVPTSDDLAAICPVTDVRHAVHALAQRLIRSVDGAPPDHIDWSDPLLTALSEALATQDRQSAISFRLTCPNCDNNWPVLFDIVSYLWKEIDWRAREILDDVLDIAKAFGWREADILSMPPARRAHYLKRATA